MSTTRLPATGEVVEVSGNSPLTLDENDVAWVIEEGEVLLFGLDLRPAAEGRRYFIATFEPGEALFGAPVDGDTALVLLAVGAHGTSVRRVPRSQLRTHVADGGSAQVTYLVSRWSQRIAEGLHRRHRGAAREVTRHAFAEDEEAVAAAVVDGGVWPDLESHDRQALQGLRALLGHEEAAQARRLEESLERDEQAADNAILRLASILAVSDGAEHIAVADDPLLAALRAVAAHDGLEVRAPEASDAQPDVSALDAILNASRIRDREVSLGRDWWTADAGAMLGKTTAGDPVALLPTSHSSYVVVNPALGKRTEVDARTATEIDTSARVLYRSLPPRSLSGRDVLAHAFRGARGDAFRLLGYGAAAGLIALATPIATEALYNSVIPTAARTRLLALTLALVAAAVAAALLQVGQSVALTRLQSRMDDNLQSGVWDRLLRLPATFFRRYEIGDLVQRALAVDAIRQVLAQAGFGAVVQAVFGLFSVALMLLYDPLLGVAAGVMLLGGTAYAIWRVYRQLPYQSGESRQRTAALTLQLLTGISKLRVAAAERRAFARWAAAFARQQENQLAASRLDLGPRVLNAVWLPAVTLVVFLLVARQGLDATDPGRFLAFMAAFGQVLVATQLIVASLGSLLQIRPLMTRMQPIFVGEPEVDDDKVDPGELTGGLEVSRVTFRYVEDGPIVLNDVSFSVEAGQFVALVGPSGAGKSSLLRLVLGFDRPEQGSILFDGEDLANLDLERVRRQIGVVLQNASLLPGTVMTNIIGSSTLTRDDAWHAAELAGLAEDIRRMPMGMETMITEGGSTLSGGQRQRIIIARALARSPKMMLFDEATSALDNLTQQTVTESLDRLDLSRIVIAHRLSTVRNADKIVVLVRGRVEQQGTFEELMSVEGTFRDLASRQIA